MKRYNFSIAVACLFLALAPSLLFAQSYLGGSYDGYDCVSSIPVMGGPNVMTLAATNVMASSAWMNGVLNATGTAATVVYVYWGTNDGGTNKANWKNQFQPIKRVFNWLFNLKESFS